MKKQKQKIDIIGVCSDNGASLQGCDKGPKALRDAGLIDSIKALGYHITDHGDIFAQNNNSNYKYEADLNKTASENPIQSQACPNQIDHNKADFNQSPNQAHPKLKNLNEVKSVNGQLGKMTFQCLQNGGLPVIIGGDHSLTAGSAYAALKHYGKIGVIWVDAHGDFNNEESSPSGNIHGMPLSALTGFGPDEILPDLTDATNLSKSKKAPFINPKNVVIIGARDLNDEEKKRLKKSGITVFTMEEIDQIGMYAIVTKAIKIAKKGTAGIYLSFDLDSIDPSVAAAVGTPMTGGLTYRETHLLCEQAFKSGRLIAVDIVELNPDLDQSKHTASVAVQLVCSMLGKTLY